DVGWGEVEKAQIGPAGAEDRVRVVQGRQVSPDERRDAGLRADAVGEPDEETPAVFRAVVVNGLAGDGVHEVAAVLDESASDGDAVVDGKTAAGPVGHREANGERAL